MMMKTRLLALSLASVISVAVEAPLQAQDTSRVKTYTVPAQPLAAAVSLLAQQAGVRIVLREGAGSSITSNPVAGAVSVAEALTTMLAGTGLSWHDGGSGVVLIDGSTDGTGTQDHVLSAVRVEGAQSANGAFADLSGFGVGAGANGSSDVTATEGTRSLTGNGASVASKIPQALKDTPQTVNVLTLEQFKQQNLIDLRGALDAVPGLTVFANTGNRPAFISRGFQVKTYQIDGGAPLQVPGTGYGVTLPDLSEYDHVEIVRGSDALFGGASDPGGVVSFQRKRPLDHRQLVADAQYGSWNFARLEIDASTPVALDGALRVRTTAAYQDQDYFYDYAHTKLLHLYGVVEADLGPDTIVRFGGSYQWRRDNSSNQDGVSLYVDGTDPRLPRSVNYTTLWSYIRENQGEQFLGIDHRFSDDWNFKLNATRRASRSDSFLPGFGGAIDPNGPGPFGSGVVTYGGVVRSEGHQRQFSVSASLTGSFQLFSRKQSFAMGADYSKSKLEAVTLTNFFNNRVTIDPFNFKAEDLGSQPPTLDITGSSVPGSLTQSFGPSINKQVAAYVQLLLEPIAGFHVNGGARYTTSIDESFVGLFFPAFNFTILNPAKQKYKGNVTPSVGLVYDITDSISIYGNYSDIFNPGGLNLDINRKILPPQRGRTFEGGIKAAPADGKLNISLAYFNTKQSGVPIQITFENRTPSGSCCYTSAGAVLSQGIDFQISGALTDRWQINGGYSYTKVRYNEAYLASLVDAEFPFAQTQQPKHQVKIWTTYTLGGTLEGLELSGGLRLDSRRYTGGQSCPAYDPVTFVCTAPPIPFGISEPLHVIGDARIAYQVTDAIKMSLLVKNLTNVRYFDSVNSATGDNYFGQPRSVTVVAHLAF